MTMPAHRIPPAQAVADLIARGIRPLESYPGTAKAKWRVECMADGCEHSWSTTLVYVRGGRSCRNCKGTLPLSEVQALESLATIGARALEPYPGHTQKKWRVECLVDDCKYGWTTTLSIARYQGSGCPACGRVARVDETQALADLAAANMKAVDPYPGNVSTPWKVECLVDDCKYRWSPKLKEIRSRGDGCPRCGDRAPIPPEEALAGLAAIGAKALDPYPGRVSDPWKVECLKCEHRWPSNLHTIRKGHGCPKCGGVARIEEAEALDDLAVKGIGPLEGYPGGVSTSWSVECLVCDWRWSTKLKNVRQGHGCPACAGRFDPSAPTDLYLMANTYLGAVKIGVARVGVDRIDQHERHGWTVVFIWSFDTGAEARDIEQTILDSWRTVEGLPDGVSADDMPQNGSTETAPLGLVNLSEVIDHINRLAPG